MIKLFRKIRQDLLEKTTYKLLLTNAIKTIIQIQTEHHLTVNETLEINNELIKSIDNYLGLTPEMVNTYLKNTYKKKINGRI